MSKDITPDVGYRVVDDECLCVNCKCGEEVYISIYKDMPNECHRCGRKMYFKNNITVYEITDEIVYR